MTEIGQIIDGVELGIKSHGKYIYAPCVVCGQPRWTAFSVKGNQPRTSKCLSCSIKLMHERNRLNIPPKGEPYVGEIRYGREIPSLKDHKHKYIYARCPDCEKERWVSYRYNPNMLSRCQPCSAKLQVGENAPRWKGGRIKHSEGYVELKLYPDDFFFPMANANGYVAEHRLVMAKHLNRCLLPWEIVHHKNGTRDDNRLENLQLLPSRKYHIADTLIKSLVKTMEKRIDYLETLLQSYGIKF